MSDTNTGAAAPQDERDKFPIPEILPEDLDAGDAFLSEIPALGRYECAANPKIGYIRTVLRSALERAALPAQAVAPAQILTPDEARAAAFEARNMSGPSDTTSPATYVMAGARAAVAKAAPVQAVAPIDPIPAQWNLTLPQARHLAAEIIAGAEAMGADEDETAILQVRLAGTVRDDDGKLNERAILAIEMHEYAEEGVYPIDPAEAAPAAVAKDVAPSDARSKWANQPDYGRVGDMTPERAAFFLDRFKRDEKMLGANEQWALDFAIAALAAPQAGEQESVLIDGTAYDVPAAVAGELLRLHMAILQAPAAPQAVPDAWIEVPDVLLPMLSGPQWPGSAECGPDKYTGSQMLQYGRKCAEAQRQLAAELLLPAQAAQPAAQPADAKPFAYLARAENGNTIIWSVDKPAVSTAAEKYGRPLEALYLAPATIKYSLTVETRTQEGAAS